MPANTESKDKILNQVKVSSTRLSEEIVSSIYGISICIAINLTLIILLLMIICVISLVYLSFISFNNGLIAIVMVFVYFFILSFVFVLYTRDFSTKRVFKANEIYNNFVESEDVLLIIEGAAGAYLEASGI